MLQRGARLLPQRNLRRQQQNLSAGWRAASTASTPGPQHWLDQGRRWVELDTNAETRATIAALVDAGDHQALKDVLGSRLSFGTAGLRGRMGAGYNRMNDLVILQTAQGLCE